MRTRAAVLTIVYLIMDLAAIALSLLLSAMYSISTHVIAGSRFTLAELNLPPIGILLCLLWYFSTKSTGLYDNRALRPYSVEVVYALKNIVVQFLTLILILFSLKDSLLTRTFVLSYALVLTVTVLAEKFALRFIIDRLTRGLRAMGNVLIIGANELGKSIHLKLTQSPLTYDVVGYIDDKKTR